MLFNKSYAGEAEIFFVNVKETGDNVCKCDK